MRVKASLLAVAILTVALLPAAPAFAGEATKSPALVKQLVSAMQARQLEAIATPDPAEPGRIVAALSFPGVQMLVMSTRHKAADALQAQIAKRQFRDVYEALQLGYPDGRVFFHDLGCDGFGNDDFVDIYYEGAKQKTMFDGNYMAQSLTEEAYAAKLKEADEKYAHALKVLIDAVKKLPITT